MFTNFVIELIHHGKILKDDVTLQDSGVKSGEMVHVVKKKVHTAPAPAPSYTDAELQQLNTSLRTLGCTPNAPGWTRAMQVASIIQHFFLLIYRGRVAVVQLLVRLTELLQLFCVDRNHRTVTVTETLLWK